MAPFDGSHENRPTAQTTAIEVSTKRALAIGIPLVLGFFVVLLVLPVPPWVKIVAAVVGVGCYWRYRWITGIREQTLEALRLAKHKESQRRAARENNSKHSL